MKVVGFGVVEPKLEFSYQICKGETCAPSKTQQFSFKWREGVEHPNLNPKAKYKRLVPSSCTPTTSNRIELKLLGLKGQIIKRLYRSSKKDNWALLETNKLIVELRLGGLRPTSENRSSKYLIDLPVVGKTIKAVKTDHFALYLELEDGACLIHSDTCIDQDGNTSFELILVDKASFDKDKREWYDSDSDLKVIE